MENKVPHQIQATAAIATVVAAAASADTVHISFESLDQSGVFAGATWAPGSATTLIDDQFLTLGIDFNGGGSGFHHTNAMLFGGDGDISLMNAYHDGSEEVRVPVMDLTAVGGVFWEGFSLQALTTSEVTMTAYDSGGGILESIALDTATEWGHFAFTTGGISSVRFEGAGGDLLIDDLQFTAVAIPLPPAAGMGLAGLGLVVGVQRCRRRCEPRR